MSSFKSQEASAAVISMFWECSCIEWGLKGKRYIQKVWINFLSEIASKCSLERPSMQKRVTVQLKKEWFAPPSAMNHKMHCAEQILAWTWDRQVWSSYHYNVLKICLRCGAKHSPQRKKLKIFRRCKNLAFSNFKQFFCWNLISELEIRLR